MTLLAIYLLLAKQRPTIPYVAPHPIACSSPVKCGKPRGAIVPSRPEHPWR